MSDRYEQHLCWLGISLQRSTDAVPNDGRYYVLRGAETYYASANLALAEAYLEMLEEEERAANPKRVDPREFLRKEQAFNDILSVRGAARARARAQQEAKGGKGGRGGA